MRLNSLNSRLLLLTLAFGSVFGQGPRALALAGCESMFRPVQTDLNGYMEKAIENVLESQVSRDSSHIVRMGEVERGRHVLKAGRDGHIVFRESGEKLHTDSGEVILGVWNFQNGRSGEIYGVVDDAGREMFPVKHSSFNSNKPVLGAWMMKADRGRITEIIDGSGHYQPTPIHMYYMLKHLIAQGWKIGDINVRFQYGIEGVGGLRMNVNAFINAVERQPEARLESWLETRYSRAERNDFLKFLETETTDAQTKVYINLFRIRYSGTVEAAIPHLKEVARLMASNTFTTEQTKRYLDSIFLMRVENPFADFPVYFVKYEDTIAPILHTFKDTLLQNTPTTKRSALRESLEQYQTAS